MPGILAKLFATKARPVDPMIQAGRLVVSLLPSLRPLSALRTVHLAQVIHLGRHGVALFDDPMFASAMGPMNERLLSDIGWATRLAGRGRQPADRWVAGLDPQATASIRTACDETRGATETQISAFAHRDESAWAACYAPDAFGKTPIGDPTRWTMPQRSVYHGPLIKRDAMIAEYKSTFGLAEAA